MTAHALPGHAMDAMLEWTPPETRTDGTPLPGVIGYNIYYGLQPGEYSQTIQDIPTPAFALSDLDEGVTYYMAVTAICEDGKESALSDEIVWNSPRQATLTLISDSGSTSPDSGSHSYEEGTLLVVTAEAPPYYHFTHWSGDVTGEQAGNNPLELLMEGEKIVVAHFAPTYTVNHATPHWWLAAHGITNDLEATVQMDLDGDGVPVWQEYIMDSDPTNPNSHLRVDVPTPLYEEQGGDEVLAGFVIRWTASPERIYRVEYATSLAEGDWTAVPELTDITPWTEEMVVTNRFGPDEGPAMTFYRVLVGLP